MSFDVEIKPSGRPRLWLFLLAGAAIVVVLLAAFNFAARHSAQHAPEVVPLPFGAAEQAYAPNVQFQGLRMSRFGNMLNQDVTYLSGQLVNGGNRIVADLQVTVEFRSAQNKVVLRETMRPLGAHPAPMAAGESRDFQLGFEQVPDDWNMQYPSVRVTGLLLR